MRRETLAGLPCAITGGPDRAGGGDGPVVVLMHGFGAPGEDLVPLWRVLDVPEATRFVFPAAPLALDMPFSDGRAWWMIDMVRLERMMATGRTVDLSNEVPAGLAAARDQVIALVGEIGARLGAPASSLVLGGFSQGAMLACDVVLRTGLPFAGMALLSGALIAESEWVPLMPQRRGLKVFQSHGDFDPLLPVEGARRLRQHFLAAGLVVEWVGFPGGHEIPAPVLDGLGAFLSSVW
jgi:phospholipase/carboxylesterase